VSICEILRAHSCSTVVNFLSMSFIRPLTAALVSVLLASVLSAAETVIRFDAPAEHFTASCPVGNGRLGAMLFGGVDEEFIVLNESTMWSGSPQDADRPNAAAVLPEIRRLLLEGKNAEAEKLVSENFTCAGRGSGYANGKDLPYGSYQLLGHLRLRFVHEGAGGESVTQYTRTLDLADALARVAYERGGVRYSRELFASAPHQAIVLRLAADRPGALAFDLTLDRPERATTAPFGNDGLRFDGQLNAGQADVPGVRFATRLRVLAPGAKISIDGGTLHVRDAREALVIVTAATDIRSFAGRRSDRPGALAESDLATAAAVAFGELRAAHVADYREWFNRASIRIGPANRPVPETTTQARLVAHTAGKADGGLAELYFNFGRYLLISSSRPGELPANLQGLWTDSLQTPWNGDWHLNVNVQMNYWPAEVTGLSELHRPLFALIRSLTGPGAATARKYYDAGGWVAHVLSNPWGFTSPGEGASWGATTTGSAWLCQHLWEHYLYTGNREFLTQAYPIMKGSAQFYLDMLIEEPTNKWLVTAPSNSPENKFRKPDGTEASICLGATFDMQVLRYLFTATIAAAETLDSDPELREQLKRARSRLAPTRIGPDGRVLEWLEPYEEPEPEHRHISHLWGLFPGHEISREHTPDLAKAARATLERRGDGGTGWAIAHKLTLWARLGDGDRAYKLFSELLRPATVADQITVEGGGSYPNLFCAHPPFQIDGNFGGAAGVAEMLLQSRVEGSAPEVAALRAEIKLLPAAPKAWAEGNVRGLRARGGYRVDFDWREGKVTHATIHGKAGAKGRLRFPGGNTEFTIGQNGRFEFRPN
jgi:alpha-L-fucosidase 2